MNVLSPWMLTAHVSLCKSVTVTDLHTKAAKQHFILYSKTYLGLLWGAGFFVINSLQTCRMKEEEHCYKFLKYNSVCKSWNVSWTLWLPQPLWILEPNITCPHLDEAVRYKPESRVWLAMGSFGFLLYLILPAAQWAWWDSASNRNKYQEYFIGVKDGRCVGPWHLNVPIE